MGRWGQRQLRGRKQASLWELKLLVYRDFRQNGGGSVTELRGAVTTSPSEALLAHQILRGPLVVCALSTSPDAWGQKKLESHLGTEWPFPPCSCS